MQVVEFERSQLGKGGECKLRAVEQPGEEVHAGSALHCKQPEEAVMRGGMIIKWVATRHKDGKVLGWKIFGGASEIS